MSRAEQMERLFSNADVTSRISSWRDKDEFKACVLEWADRLGVKTRSLSVRPMCHKWASCSTAGNLSFNSELLELDRELGVYVIVHELLHFFAPNHGRLWKSLMRTHLGDHENMSQRLPPLQSLTPVVKMRL